jgi:uncharacterized protein YjbK
MAHREETELKYRLAGERSYRKLCAFLGPPAEEWEQINHYYQSEDGTIPGKEGVIRIRAEKGRVWFTVKREGTLLGGLARSLETEVPWEGSGDVFPPGAASLWDAGHPGLKALAAERGGAFELVHLGGLVNRRRAYRLRDGLVLEVDASRYPDGTRDFEVEMETLTPERDRPKLLKILQEAGVRPVPQTETKYQRFLGHLVSGSAGRRRSRARRGSEDGRCS